MPSDQVETRRATSTAGPGAGADDPVNEWPDDYVPALRRLGMSQDEALTYASLLAAPRSASEVGEIAGLPPGRDRELLEDLQMKGLVKRLPGRPTRYAATPPDLALPVLLGRLETELEESRQAVHHLMREHRSRGRGAGREYVEIAVGLEGLRAQFESVQSGAEFEILGSTKSPILLTSPQSGNPGQEQALARGVENRWIYERSVLELPGMMEDVRRVAALGEQSRVIASLPSKMFIVDRKLALVHVTEQSSEGPQIAGLLTLHPELVGTLHRLFEFLWEAATPLFPRADPTPDDGSELDALVRCLLAGMKDDTIARQLNVSRRTVARRIRELLGQVGAETRFQAGFTLGRRFTADRDEEARL